MGNEDWYRNEIWSQEIENAFFEKLKRSRTQKAQYLKIQSYYLLENHPDMVLRLIKYVRDNCPDEFWEQDFCLYESKALFSLGEIEKSIDMAFKSIEWRIKKPNTQTEIPYWIAELVLRSKKFDYYQRILKLLVDLHCETPFPAIEFRFHGYSALLLLGLGERERARTEAVKAIEWASRDKNFLQNERKRKLGIFRQKLGWPYDDILRISKGNGLA